MVIKKTTWLSLSMIILLGVITAWRILFINAYFGWGDARVFTRSNETWQSFFEPPNVWTSLYDLGAVDLGLSQYPIYAGYAALTRLGIDSRLVAKIIFFFPAAILPGLGSFLLIKHFTKRNLPAIMGSIVYSYNVNALLMLSTLLQISIAYALAPLVLFLFIKTLETKNFRIALATGLISFIDSFYEFRIFYIVSLVMLFYLIFHLSVIEGKSDIFKKARTVLIALMPFVVVAALSAYWVVPYTQLNFINDNHAFSRPLFGDQYMSLKQSLSFFSPWWTGGKGYANGVVQPIPNYFWLIPVVALLGFVLNLRNPNAYFFVILSCLGILLTKQSDKPFPNLYLWLYQHFPGFNAFREASKFYLILSLGYSGLISYLISSLKSRRTLSLVISGLVSLLFLWNAKPLVTGDIGGIFVPKNRPQDFETISAFINEQPDFFRTAWFPAAGIWGHYETLHPKIDLHTFYFDTLSLYISKQPGFSQLANDGKSIRDINYQVFNLFSQPFSNQLLDSLSIKYIIVPPQDKASDDDVFVNYGLTDREYILNFLDRQKYLSRINAGLKEAIIYENSDYTPHISGGSQPIANTRTSPSNYQITVPPSQFPSEIIFSEAFHPNWTISLGGQDYPSQKHEDLVNSFLLPPQSTTRVATLSFMTQKYVNYGTIISIASLALVAVFLIYPKRHV